MEKKNNIGMGHEVTAPNNNYKFYVSAKNSSGDELNKQEFSSFEECVKAFADNHIRGTYIRMVGHDGAMYVGYFPPKEKYLFQLIGFDGTKETYTYYFGKELTDVAIDGMAEILLEKMMAVSDAEDREKRDRDSENIGNIVSEYQTEVDGYVEDLKKIAPNVDHIETAIDAFASREILKKIKKLSEDCLTAIGEYTECSMVWDDGWHVDLSEVARWYGIGETEIDDEDLENIIGTVDNYTSTLRIGLSEECEEYLEEFGTLPSGYFCDGPYEDYLWEDIEGFASTYYHYAYCA